MQPCIRSVPNSIADRVRTIADELASYIKWLWHLRLLDLGLKGEEMSDELSQSIFTVEVDREPVLAIRGKKHSEAEAVLADVQIRKQLSLLKSAGKPLCDDFSIFRIRLARAGEKELFAKTRHRF